MAVIKQSGKTDSATGSDLSVSNSFKRAKTSTMSVRIDADLHRKFRTISTLQGIPIVTILEQFVQRYVEEHKPKAGDW